MNYVKIKIKNKNKILIKSLICVFIMYVNIMPNISGASISRTNQSDNCTQQVAAWAFDWDDNIINMPTKLMLFQKNSNDFIYMSTGDYAKFSSQIGKTGEYANYEIRTTDTENSFKYFRDPNDPNNLNSNYFINDLKQVINSTDVKWKGPSWDAFIYALNNESAAKWTAIITARGHAPETIYNGLKYLQEQGIIRYLPNIDNIHPVTHASHQVIAASPAEIKAKVMIEMLDEISTCSFGYDPDKIIVDHDGIAIKQLHIWGFSDDDYKNYKTASDVLSKEIKNGRWNNIKISLFYTGDTAKNRIPYVVTFNKSGEGRSPVIGELIEGYKLSKNKIM